MRRDYRLRAGDMLEIIYHVRHQRNPLYRIKIQDIIDIRFPFSPSLNQTQTVQSDGTLQLDLIGAVYVFDSTIQDVRDELIREYAKYIRNLKESGGLTVSFKASSVKIAELKLAIAGLVLLILAAIFFPALSTTERATGGVAQMDPIRTRQRLLHDTLEILRYRPVVGVGFGHYFDVERLLAIDPAVAGAITTGAGYPHNLVLVLLAETGIVGLLGVVLVLVLLFRESLKLYRKIPPSAPGYLSREFVVLFWIMLTAWLVDAMFVDPFGDLPGNGLFWVMGGLMMGYRRLLEPHPIAPSIAVASAGG